MFASPGDTEQPVYGRAHLRIYSESRCSLSPVITTRAPGATKLLTMRELTLHRAALQTTQWDGDRSAVQQG